MPLEIRIYNQTGTNDKTVQLLSVDTGTTLPNAYYVYYTNRNGTNPIINRVNGVNGTAISTNFTNLPTFADGKGKNYRQLFVQYAESGTIWFALTTNNWTTNGSNPAPTAAPTVPWSDAPFGDIEYAYMGSPYDTADATAINTAGIPMLLQLCTNVNTPVPGSSTVGYRKGFTNTNAIPSMLANMGEITSAPWFGAAPNTNIIRFVGPSSAAAGGIQMPPGGSTNSNPLYSGGWPGQVAPSFAPYLYQVSNSTPLGTGPGGYKIYARISNSIGLNPTPGVDSGTNDYFYWFSFDVTLLPNPNAPKPTAAQLNWLNGVSTASNTPYYWTPIVVLTNGVIISSNKTSGALTTNNGLGARYTPDGGAATNSWFSSYIYGAPATYSAPNASGTNTGYVTLLPSAATWSNLATSQGFDYHATWAPSIQDSMLNEIAFGFAGGFVNSPVQGWPVWFDSQNNQVPPGGAAPVTPNTSVSQTNIGAMPSCSWWVQTNLYAQNQPRSPLLNNNPWFSAWGQSIYQVSKVVYSHPISDRMKNAQFSPGLPLILAHTNTNFPPATIQPWLEVYLYNPNSAGQSSQVPVITSSTNAIRLTNTPTGVDFPSYTIAASNSPQGYDVAALPPGLKFDPYTAKIYGTIPPQSQISPTLNLNPYILQLFAYNQNGVGTAEVPLYVASPANTTKPSGISPTGQIQGSSFVSYNFAQPLVRFTANQMGSTPVTTKWTLTSGTLPGGLAFSYQTNNGEVSAYITGTATNTNIPSASYTIEISNAFGSTNSTFSLKLQQGTGNTNKPSNFTPTVLAGPAGGPPASISLNAPFGPVILTGSNLVGATWSLAPDSNPVPPGVQWTTNPAASGEVFAKVWSSGGVKNSTQGVLKFLVSNNFGVATNPIGFIFGTPNSNKCTFTSYTITGTQGNPSILASTPVGLGGTAFPLNINNGTQFNLSNSLDALWTPPTNLPAGLTFSTQPQSGGNAGQVWATVGGSPSGNTLNLQTFQTNTNTVNFVISNNVGVQTNTLSFIIAPTTPPPSGAPTVTPQTTNVNQYQWIYIQPSGVNLNYAKWSCTNTALPQGLRFYSNLPVSGTRLGGILAGQITANAGTYVVGFVATNPFGASTGNITITVSAAPNPNANPVFVTPAMVYTGNVGSNTLAVCPEVPFYTAPAQFPVRAQLYPPNIFSNQPAVVTVTPSSLPPGLTLTNWPTPNGMSAQFVGTPTTPGSYTVPVTLSNASGITNTNAVFTIRGAAALPSITSSNTASGQSGLAFTFQLTANNGPVGYGAQNLPSWLTLNSNAPAAGLIHGTPPAIFQGTLPNIKVWATNAGGSGPTSNLSITITEPAVPSITSPLTATATNGLAFSYQITANNFPYSFGAQGLPTWLAINDNTGLITGTPPADTRNGSVSYVLLTAVNTAGTGHTILTLTTTNPVAKPVVTSATTNATVGTAFSYQIQASRSPNSYGVTPPLPAGLSLNTSTGLISGTPSSSAAQNNYTISASNAGGTGQGSLTLTISAPPAPVISSAGTATATSGTAFSYTITASGNPTSFGATPLPAWASFNATTGVISGTPGPSNVGTVVIALTATNPSGTGRKNLTLTVQYNSGTPAPVITSAGTASGRVGQAFNFPQTASGSPTLWTISPTPMSDGLSFNGANGAISGTPTSAGTYNYTVSAYNNGGVGQKPLQLTFTNPLSVPVITSAATAVATNGRAFSYRITATQNPTNFAASNRPAWLGAPNAQGIMTGTPTATGSANLRLYAANSAGRGHAPLALSIVVNPSVTAPTITSTNAASGIVGQNLTFTFKASGGTPITWSVSPALPANLSLNAGSGAVTGIPQSSGTNSYTVTASNAGGTANQTWTLGIASIRPPVITSPRTATGQSGNLFSYTITASNNPTSFQASNRPAWLSAPNAQGVMTGTPPGTVTSNVVLYASNSAGRGHANLTITITSPVAKPVITSTGAITATQGLAFNYQITASGNPNLFGAAPLPPGLSVNPANGLISGTPSSVGVSKIELSARNAGGTGNKELVLTEQKKGSVPVITSANTSTGKVSQDFRYQITASGSPTSYTATDLPLGLNVNSASGLISGKPTRAGTNQVMLTASNVFGAGSLQMQLVVQANPDLPVITSPGVASGTKGFQFRYQIRASGNPTSYNATGLPSELSVNRSTGLISGVAKGSGRFTVMLSADNSFGTGTKPLNLILDPSPNPNARITSSLAEATLTVGQPYSYQITANNSPTYYSASGLPPGLKVNRSTGVISGWPAFVGEHAVTLEAVRDVPGQLVTTASGTKVLLIQAASGSKPPTPPPNAW